MIDSDALSILFHERLGKDGGVLFASQAELARAIREHEAFRSKPDTTVRAFLNQALKRGNERYSRPISPNLHKAIWQAVSKRVAPKMMDEVLAHLNQKFLELKDSSRFEKPLDHDEEWNSLVDAANTARRQVIITPTPAENISDTHANTLTSILCERLLLDSIGDKGVIYEFYIPDCVQAQLMLNNLIKYLSLNKGMTTIQAQALIKHAIERGALSITAISTRSNDSPGLSPPMVVFEPENSDRSGYLLFYHPKNRVSVARIDEGSLSTWSRDTYPSLSLRGPKFDAVDVVLNEKYEVCLEPGSVQSALN